MLVYSSVKIVALKNNASNDGKVPLYLQIVAERIPYRISLKKKIPLESWVNTPPIFVSNRGKHKIPNSKELNNWLATKVNEANKIILRADMNGEDIDFKEFKIRFLKKDKIKPKHSFFDLHDKIMQTLINAGKINSESTLKTYHSIQRKIRKYSPNLEVNEINADWLQDFETYLRTKEKNGTEAVYKKLAQIRKVCEYALSKKIIADNPFFDIKLDREDNRRVEFTSEEVQKLETIYSTGILSSHLKRDLEILLFSIETGLDYRDLTDLSFNHFTTINEIKVIQKKRKKSPHVQYTVPLSQKSLKYIGNFKDEGKVFQIIENTKLNGNLKKIFNLVGISRTKSLHCGRHTFATIQLNKGIRREIVQAMMGHKNERMTQRYAQMKTSTVIDEFLKYN